MDPLAGLLEGPRARSAFVLRMVMEPPWAVLVQDEAPLTVVAVVAGQAWAAMDDRADPGSEPAPEPVRLSVGQVALFRGPDPYRLSDQPDTPAQIVVDPGQRCHDLAGRPLEEALMQGVRTWGNDPDGSTVLIVGTYEQIGEPGARLLGALPALTVIDGADVGSPVVDLIGEEMIRDVPGQQVVLDRLLDLLTVSALRTWFDRAGPDAPGWWQATAHPVVGPALRLIQHNPAHNWTVASLAAEVGVSRAALARQFSERVGQPPMAFLTEWRLALAADLLADPGATVAGVASQVGYSTGFALSAAFKRHHGHSPTTHRQLIGAAR